MLDSARDLFRHRALLRALTAREVRARYRGSALGFVWSFLNPLLLLAVYTFVFRYVFVPILGRGPEPYPVFLFTGLLPWTWFAGGLLEGSGSILGGGGLLKKVVFPAEILPLVAVLANGVHFVIALPVLVIVLAVTGHPLTANVLFIVPLLAIQRQFIAGMTVGLAALTVLFRDIRDLLTHVVQLWFFATPIIYEVGLLPPQFRSLMRFNPLAQLIRGWQDALFYGRAPSVPGLLGAAAAAVLAAVVGYFVFDRLRELLPEEV